MVNEDILKYLPPDMIAAYKKVETLKNYHEIMKRISKGLSSEQTEEEFTKERRAEDQNFNNIKNMEESETMIDYKKKYEEALERAKAVKETYFNLGNISDAIVLESIFPELKESEGERIRKQLLSWFKDCKWNAIDNETLKREDIIAWLEKQSEQKSNDIYPIFRVGDYIKNKKTGDKILIEQLNIATKAYCYVSYDGAAGNHSDFPFVKQDEWELIGQKVVEQKPAWSEEDEARYYGVIETEQYMLDVVNGTKNFDIGNTSIREECAKELNWLKSLKERYTWKPTNGQMKALWDSIPENVKEISEREMLLDSLYQDLKKLKEE